MTLYDLLGAIPDSEICLITWWDKDDRKCKSSGTASFLRANHPEWLHVLVLSVEWWEVEMAYNITGRWPS